MTRGLLATRAWPYKRVRREAQVVHHITGFHGRVTGQERTTVTWTLTFRRTR